MIASTQPPAPRRFELVPSRPPRPVSPVQGGGPSRPHLRALGFLRDPFPVVPDANGFFLSRRGEAMVTEILHSIESRRGFIILTGEVGLGKTTLSRRLLLELEERGVRTALVFNTFHEGGGLLREINRDFGLQVEGDDLFTQMTALNAFLLRNLAEGVNCTILIDDAQQLSFDSLEMVRQISNLETDREKLVQIVLIGQPELDEKLACHELRQLASRVALRHRAEPFTLEETRRYVEFKLGYASGHGRLRVTPKAFARLQELSGGNPRRINALMDRCLYGAIAYGSDRIDHKLVAEAARDAGQPAVEKPAPAGIARRIAGWAALLVLLPLLAFLLANPARVREASATPTAWLAARGLWPAPAEVVRGGGDRAGEPALAAAAVAEPTPAAPTEVEPAAAERSAPPVSDVAAPALTVEAFLASYGLEAYASDFAEALERGWTDEISARIRLATALRLVTLAAPPDGFDGTVLSVAGPEPDSSRHLLFWRPTLWSPAHTYFHYRDSEVRALQYALAALGHYAGEVDGLAGPLTSTALRRFQAAAGLPATGVPDTATLFRLELESRAVAPPPREPGRLASGVEPGVALGAD